MRVLAKLQQTEPAHLNVLLSSLYDSHRLTRNSARKVRPTRILCRVGSTTEGTRYEPTPRKICYIFWYAGFLRTQAKPLEG